VEEMEVLALLPCSEMNLPHPEEEVQMVEVEKEPKMKTLPALRLKEYGPILVKQVGVGPSSHPILKRGYLNLWRLRRWWRARRLKPLSIVH
jgi:hypothetical protein